MKFRLKNRETHTGRNLLYIQKKAWLFWRTIKFEYMYPDDFSRNPSSTHQMYFYIFEHEAANNILHLAINEGELTAIKKYIDGNFPWGSL